MGGLTGWKQGGSVSLWRYIEHARDFNGWHFTADEEGCRSLLALLDQLEVANEPASYRTLQVTKATPAILAVPNNGSARALSPARWRLRHAPASEEWRWAEDGDTLELTVGLQGVQKLRASVSAVLRHEGDFSVGPGGGQLWFWWWRRG